MNAKNKVLLYALVIGLLLYVIDTLIYYYLFSDENTFLQVLVTAVPLNQLYNRLLMFAGVMIFAFIVTGMISDLSLENEFLKHQSLTSTPQKPDTSFVTGLSYQIRTPLNAIVGFSELLKDPNLSMQSKLTYVNHIHSSGNYLLQLVNNLVDISRIESGQFTVKNEEISLNTLLDELFRHFDEYKKEMGRADVALVLKKGIKDDKLTILTDKERLNQVLTNLLENAFKKTEEGMVEFGYQVSDDEMLEFYVRDTGKGYSMERLENILNRHMKLSDNHNHAFDSAALLLSITRNIVKLLGGTIRAESRPGQGAVFQFNLPFRKVESGILTVKSKTRTDSRGEHDWRNKTVLIAEDVESNFIYLQELLRPTGILIHWAKNGLEAIEIAKKHDEIDLVLMDILMPEMDGYEAAKIVKEKRQDLPVIAQTAYSIESDRDKSRTANFDDYLIKPIWSPQLISAMEKYLS